MHLLHKRIQNLHILADLQNQILRLNGYTNLHGLCGNEYKTYDTYIKSCMFGYCLTIINNGNSKLSKIMYNIMHSESLQGGTYKWLNHINIF